MARRLGLLCVIALLPAMGGTSGGDTATPPAAPIPGTIEAEDFLPGGEGVGYHDTTAGNNGTETSRDPTDVDVKTAADCGLPTPCVGWMATGEWLDYSVEIARTGSYTFTFRVSSALDTGRFRVLVDGVDVTGIQSAPNTGSYTTWTDVVVPAVALAAGTRTLRLDVVNEFFDLDAIHVVSETVDTDAGPPLADAGPPPADAGPDPPGPDAGNAADGGSIGADSGSAGSDAGAGFDAGMGSTGPGLVAHGSGCRCGLSSPTDAPGLGLWVVAVVLALTLRRRR